MTNTLSTILSRELALSGALYLYRQSDDSWRAYEASAWMLAQLSGDDVIVGETDIKPYDSVLSTASLASPLDIPDLTRFCDIAVDDDTLVIGDCGIEFDPESYIRWREEFRTKNNNDLNR